MYRNRLVILGQVLKQKLPEITFTFESYSGVWLTKDPIVMDTLDSMFEFRDDWKRFLGLDDLIILFYDSDEWSGFTID